MKVSQQVEHCLQNYPRTRDSDHDLILAMLFVNGVMLDQKQKDVIRKLNFEGITRQRRKFQENGQYLPTDPEVAKRRRIKGYSVEQVAPSFTPTQLGDKIQNND